MLLLLLLLLLDDDDDDETGVYFFIPSRKVVKMETKAAACIFSFVPNANRYSTSANRSRMVARTSGGKPITATKRDISFSISVNAKPFVVDKLSK